MKNLNNYFSRHVYTILICTLLSTSAALGQGNVVVAKLDEKVNPVVTSPETIVTAGEELAAKKKTKSDIVENYLHIEEQK